MDLFPSFSEIPSIVFLERSIFWIALSLFTYAVSRNLVATILIALCLAGVLLISCYLTWEVIFLGGGV